jgi:hypothetical protein
MVVRYLRPPFSRLIVAGLIFQVAALIVFIVVAAGALTGSGGFVAVTVTVSVGIVLHLLLFLFNIFVRAEYAQERDDARMIMAADQWYSIAGLAGCIIVLFATLGLWLGHGTTLVASLIGLVLVSGPALSVLTYVMPAEMTRERSVDTIEEARPAIPEATMSHYNNNNYGAHSNVVTSRSTRDTSAAFQLLGQSDRPRR